MSETDDVKIDGKTYAVKSAHVIQDGSGYRVTMIPVSGAWMMGPTPIGERCDDYATASSFRHWLNGLRSGSHATDQGREPKHGHNWGVNDYRPTPDQERVVFGRELVRNRYGRVENLWDAPLRS